MWEPSCLPPVLLSFFSDNVKCFSALNSVLLSLCLSVCVSQHIHTFIIIILQPGSDWISSFKIFLCIYFCVCMFMFAREGTCVSGRVEARGDVRSLLCSSPTLFLKLCFSVKPRAGVLVRLSDHLALSIPFLHLPSLGLWAGSGAHLVFPWALGYDYHTWRVSPFTTQQSPLTI